MISGNIISPAFSAPQEPYWSYKKLSASKLSFYHGNLKGVPLYAVYEQLPTINSLQHEEDGSITLAFDASINFSHVVSKLLFIAEKKQVISTPRAHFTISDQERARLSTWELSFEACIGILLSTDDFLKKSISSWELVNSTSGGIFIKPFALTLYKDYPKVIYPLTAATLCERFSIEHSAAVIIKKLIHRIMQAQPGYEGIAMLSYVEEKTGIPQNEICSLITNKTDNIHTPIHSQFFTDP